MVNIIRVTDSHPLLLCIFSISLKAKSLPQGGKKGFLFFSSICNLSLHIAPQNSSFIPANGQAAADSMSLNPHIQYYSAIYVVSMGVALLLKTVRGLVFVKVSPPLVPSRSCVVAT